MNVQARLLAPGDRIRVGGIELTVIGVTPGRWFDTIHILTRTDKGAEIALERNRAEPVDRIDRPKRTGLERDRALSRWREADTHHRSGVMAGRGFNGGWNALANILTARHPELAPLIEGLDT